MSPIHAFTLQYQTNLDHTPPPPPRPPVHPPSTPSTSPKGQGPSNSCGLRPESHPSFRRRPLCRFGSHLDQLDLQDAARHLFLSHLHLLTTLSLSSFSSSPCPPVLSLLAGPWDRPVKGRTPTSCASCNHNKGDNTLLGKKKRAPSSVSTTEPAQPRLTTAFHKQTGTLVPRTAVQSHTTAVTRYIKGGPILAQPCAHKCLPVIG